MPAFILSALIGIVCIVIGILNRMGNISMLHGYHTKRVSEEDRLPFGKLVGLGIIIIGIAIIVFSILTVIALYVQNQLFITIGNGIMIAGLAAGLGISFYAIKKYNKGIF